MQFPTFSQWKQIFKVLRGAERKAFLVLAVLFTASTAFLAIDFYLEHTHIAPDFGGSYTEGVVGQPRFINPIYGETNDIDRSLIGLVYSGLMTYDKDGQIVPDLAENYQISDDGTAYTFKIRDNLFWQDGAPLTVDDVIYTIKTIQNSDYKSPLRANWLNVDAQKISDDSVALTLNSPYNSFLENCTLKIIPQHLWKNVTAENFALSSYNLQPIGSGPYLLNNLSQSNTGFISKIRLSVNNRYYDKLPYISDIYFLFFDSKESLVKAANQKKIDGFSVTSLDSEESSVEKEIRQGWSANEKFNVYSFSLPRYFAVFFNPQKSEVLSDKNVTQALNYAVNKQELLQKIESETKNKISAVDSPIMPDYFGYSKPAASYAFNFDSAAKLLDKSGYKFTSSEENTGFRSKPNAKKPAFQFKSYLKVGSKGSEVTELQGCLSRLDDVFKNILQGETSGTYSKATENAVTEFQKKYLPDSAPTGETGPATRQKLNQMCFPRQDTSLPLQFTLTTISQPQLLLTAGILKDYWQKAGIAVTIREVSLSGLKDIIKNRDYEALLYGQALGSLPDLYPFWHSTQSNDPGLNLARYQSKTADQLLKDARETLDPGTKIQKYEKLQDVILADAPVLFLYNPDYLYWASRKIKGIDTTKIVDPAKRFSNIINWYINTKRTWK